MGRQFCWLHVERFLLGAGVSSLSAANSELQQVMRTRRSAHLENRVTELALVRARLQELRRKLQDEIAQVDQRCGPLAPLLRLREWW